MPLTNYFWQCISFNTTSALILVWFGVR